MDVERKRRTKKPKAEEPQTQPQAIPTTQTPHPPQVISQTQPIQPLAIPQPQPQPQTQTQPPPQIQPQIQQHINPQAASTTIQQPATLPTTSFPPPLQPARPATRVSTPLGFPLIGSPDISALTASPLPPPYDINLPTISNFDTIPDALLDFSINNNIYFL